MPRRYGKAKQTRLAFTPIESSPPAAGHSPGNSPFKPIQLGYEHSSKGIVRRGQLQLYDYAVGRNESGSSPLGESSDERLDSSAPPTAGDLTTKSKSVEASADQGHFEEISSDEDAIQAIRRQSRQNVVALDSGSDDGPKPAPTTPARKRRMSSKSMTSEDMPEVTSARTLRSHITRSHSKGKVSDPEAKSLPTTRSTTRQQRSDTCKSSTLLRRGKSTAVDLTGLGSEETSDADELVTRPSGRKRKAAEPTVAFVVDDDYNDSDDLIVSSPAKRRRCQNVPEAPRTPRKTSAQDKLDLEEDLRDLQDSAMTKSRTRGRLADSAKTRRQRHLETLRRRRAGEKEADNVGPKGAEDNEDDGNTDGLSNTRFNRDDSEPADFSREFEEVSDDSGVESAVSSNEDLDQYEKDFVLEESDGDLGVPVDLGEIPFEFTRHRYKQPRDCFRDVVQWMVHNKLNPAFLRNDVMYRFAFMKLDDEVNGRTGSQLISSVWNTDFRFALLARPQVEITAFPTSANHPCDACNRSGHPASSDIKFYGKPYSLHNLEPLDEDEDGDGDVEDDNNDREQSDGRHGRDKDRDGHILPDEDTRFFLGKHCKAKAEMAHTLIHWRFHLNEWVIGYLERKGIFDGSSVIEREQWSQKKKARYANHIVDMMDESGEVQNLWRDFHINLKTARETEGGRW